MLGLESREHQIKQTLQVGHTGVLTDQPGEVLDPLRRGDQLLEKRPQEWALAPCATSATASSWPTSSFLWWFSDR